MILATRRLAIPILKHSREGRPRAKPRDDDAKSLHFNYLIRLSEFGTLRVTERDKSQAQLQQWEAPDPGNPQ